MAIVFSADLGATSLSNTLTADAWSERENAVPCERDEVEQTRDALATAEYRRSMHKGALERLRSDPRWDDPAQREGLEFASATTSAMLDEQEDAVRAARAQLEDCLEGDTDR